MFLCVPGHGGRRAWLATVLPAPWTSFSYRPMHVRPVWCLPACVRSVDGHVVFAVAVFWCAVVLVASWSVRSALVPCRCSGRLRSRICCVQVFCLLRCWLVPVAWGRYGTFLPCAVCPPRGGKVMTSGRTAVKHFSPIWCPCPCPALAVLHAQPIIRYFAVLCSRPSSFACAIHLYTPRRKQGPVGPPWCVPVLPMGAPGCYSSSVVWCSCSCLPACRAPYRAVFCGSCGWRACVAVLSLVVRMVRVFWLVLRCRDVPSDVVGWARRNTSVPACRGSAWPRVANLRSSACPGWGFRG